MWLKSCCKADLPMLIADSSCARDLAAETASEAVLVAAGNIVNVAASAAEVPSLKLAGVR
jgi:hypothetical protein